MEQGICSDCGSDTKFSHLYDIRVKRVSDKIGLEFCVCENCLPDGWVPSRELK